MSDLEKEIYRLECSHLQPDVRTSKEKLGDVLDGEFHEIGSSGKMLYRSEYDGDHPLTPDEMEISDFIFHKLGEETVLTTYRIDNKTSGRITLRSSIWRRRENGWKLFFHQGTISD